MRRIVVAIIFASAAQQTHCNDTSVDKFVDKLVERARMAWSLDRTGLDDLTLAKPSHVAVPKSLSALYTRQAVSVPHSPLLVPNLRSTALLPRSPSPLASSRSIPIPHARGEERAVRAEASASGRAVRAATLEERSAATAEVAHYKKQEGPSVTAATGTVVDWSGDALILMLWGRAKDDEGPLVLDGDALAVDSALGGAVQELAGAEEFAGEAGKSASVRLIGQSVKTLILVGLGPKPEGDSEVDWRQAGAVAAEAVGGKLKGSGTAAISGLENPKLQPLLEGFLLGLHKDYRFKGKLTSDKEKPSKGPSSLELFLDSSASKDLSAAATDAKSVASGVIFARELVNAPPNVLTPFALAQAAANMGTELGLEAKIYDESECEAMGMGSFLAVGRASNLRAKLIHLVYKPPGEVKRKIGIVGKGLTFDSGGYNIKAGAGSMIEMMKFDMGGSAATLGAAAAVAELKPKDVEVHFVVAACENMISGNDGALRPGDIITAMDGTTIEVGNTDAEGRLTLADAMLFAQNQGVTELVDIATLTGACMVALGQEVAGMWSNTDALARQLEESSKQSGEKLWRMPLEQSYAKGLKSDLADVKNIAGRFAGAITAALFLEKFVNKGVSWAHIDIAGTVWADAPTPMCDKGATGTFVRTLTNFVLKE
eukprot:gnl/MRDRNA2_/MRDRNA2_106557_c0_seq1.p1 gnl/MRDRNA2_/MRDRNA2_106557_c0~~gnl/MRDRNA2_/MRDRNA2_106557_c0_seq1.p1  ORF type:complete len:657 (-),score=157.21 gnl/MRDRNA2_/MRDRNA2_106557_c0_seq1:71-2041(-)